MWLCVYVYLFWRDVLLVARYDEFGFHFNPMDIYHMVSRKRTQWSSQCKHAITGLVVVVVADAAVECMRATDSRSLAHGNALTRSHVRHTCVRSPFIQDQSVLCFDHTRRCVWATDTSAICAHTFREQSLMSFSSGNFINRLCPHVFTRTCT